MKLLDCHIENFGKLSDLNYSFESGLNLIMEENGWGKSTLATFIRVMFYGFEGDRKQGLSSERRKFAPWQGGAYGGYIRFEADGNVYRLHKVFGAKEAGDVIELYDDATGLSCIDYDPSSLGVDLFGIDSESFMRTAFVSQNECIYTETTDDINKKLGNVADQTDLDAGYDTIVTRIKKVISEANSKVMQNSLYNKKKRVTELEEAIKKGALIDASLNEVYELKNSEKEKLEELRAKRSGLVSKRSACAAADERRIRRIRLDELQEAVNKRKENLKAYDDYFAGRVPEKKEVLDAMDNARALAMTEASLKAYSLSPEEEAELDRLNQSYGDYSQYDSNKDIAPRENKSSISILSIIIIIFGLACLGAGVLFALRSALVTGIVIGAVGLALVVIGFAIARVRKKRNVALAERQKKMAGDLERYKALDARRNKRDEAEAKAEKLYLDIKSFLDSIGFEFQENISLILSDLLEKVNSLAIAKNEYNKALEEIQAYVEKFPEESITGVQNESGVSIVELDELIKNTETEMSEINRRIEEYIRRIDVMKQQRDEITEKEELLDELRVKCEEEADKIRLYKLTENYLTKAKNSYTEKYMGPITRGFNKYYEILTGEEATDYSLDAKTHLSLEAAGLQRDTETLSFGYRNLIGLCMRLALFEAMYEEEKPFIVLDDPFVHMDNDKIQKGKELINRLAEDTQVIYLTCHESRKM